MTAQSPFDKGAGDAIHNHGLEGRLASTDPRIHADSTGVEVVYPQMAQMAQMKNLFSPTPEAFQRLARGERSDTPGHMLQ